jgi:hypothetical protein
MRYVLLILVLMLHTGCRASVPKQDDSSDLALKLVHVIQDGDLDKTYSALKQLRQLSATQEIDQGVLALLAVGGCGKGDPRVCDQVLATGREPIDELLFRQFLKDGRFAVALGLAQHPSSRVTQSLTNMASDGNLPPEKRRICRLLLAARGQTPWLATVDADIRAVFGEGSQEVTESSIDFLAALVRLAPKLESSVELEKVLWARLWESNLGEGETYLDALIELAHVRREFSGEAHAAQLRQWLAKHFDVRGEAFTIHMIPAALRIDTPNEIQQALAALGTPGWGMDVGEKRLFIGYSLATWLERKEIHEAIRKGLHADNAYLVLGALRTFQALGPDGADMMGDVESLQSHAAQEVRDAAREALHWAAGVDANGQWRR